MEAPQDRIPKLEITSQGLKAGRLELGCPSSEAWLNTVLQDFNSFLIDHAACERKASSLAMSFVVKYRDKKKLVETMSALAIEELEHFHEVLEKIHSAGLQLGGDEPDLYVGELIRFCRHSPQERFLDRLLISGVIEARGCERFQMIGEALKQTPWGEFYLRLSRAESKHQLLFIELALEYFAPEIVSRRLSEILTLEASLIPKLPLRPQLH